MRSVKFWHNRDIIDNRDYMDTMCVMFENPQSLSPIIKASKFED